MPSVMVIRSGSLSNLPSMLSKSTSIRSNHSISQKWTTSGFTLLVFKINLVPSQPREEIPIVTAPSPFKVIPHKMISIHIPPDDISSFILLLSGPTLPVCSMGQLCISTPRGRSRLFFHEAYPISFIYSMSRTRYISIITSSNSFLEEFISHLPSRS